MRRFLDFLFGKIFRSNISVRSAVERINTVRAELEVLNDSDLRTWSVKTSGRIETLAAAAVVAERLLGLRMFDVQLQGALALTEGRIAEMQTGRASCRERV